MKKKLLAVLVVVPVVGGLLWWSAARAPKADAVGEPKIVSVDRGPVKLVVMASGRISPNYEVDIKCKASGVVVNLPFDVSDPVKKGELVLELDPQDEKRAVEQAQSALTAAQRRVDSASQTLKAAEQTLVTDQRQAETALRSAEVNARDLRTKSDRTKKLYEMKLESQEQAESAEAAAVHAELDVDTTKNAIEVLKIRPINIEILRNEVTLAEIQVKTAQTALDDADQRLKETRVMAPIDGVVTTRPAQIGTIVSSGITNVGGGTSIMTLSDLSRLFVLVPVNEADIGKVKREQKVSITCDAYPEKKFEGTILRIAAKGLNQQNVVTFEVKIEVLGEGKELLRPEMSTDIEIIVAERENVLRVPSEAIRTRDTDKKRYVLVPAEGAATQMASSAPAASTRAMTPAAATASSTAATTAPAAVVRIPTIERDVDVGVDDGAFCEILDGLKEGDKIVIEAASQGPWTKPRGGGDDN